MQSFCMNFLSHIDQQNNVVMHCLHCSIFTNLYFPFYLPLGYPVLKLKNIDNDQIVDNNLFYMQYTVLTRCAEDINENLLNIVQSYKGVLTNYEWWCRFVLQTGTARAILFYVAAATWNHGLPCATWHMPLLCLASPGKAQTG